LDPGEVMYLDRDYFGLELRGWDMTMKLSVRGHPLGDVDKG